MGVWHGLPVCRDACAIRSREAWPLPGTVTTGVVESLGESLPEELGVAEVLEPLPAAALPGVSELPVVGAVVVVSLDVGDGEVAVPVGDGLVDVGAGLDEVGGAELFPLPGVGVADGLDEPPPIWWQPVAAAEGDADPLAYPAEPEAELVSGEE